jgi:hypothetical protein
MHLRGFLNINVFTVEVVGLTLNPQPGGTEYPLFVWAITFNLSGIGGPASSYATAGVARRIL